MARLPLFPVFQDLRGVLAPHAVQAAVTLHIDTPSAFLEAHLFNYDKLVVTFEDAKLPLNRPDRYREGWGVAPFVQRAVSVLAVKPKTRDWYSGAVLPQTLAEMQPFFQRFGTITTYGMSMGGFAALTFADLIGARRVVTMAPQSTYRSIDGRRESRFPAAFDFDHSGPYGDATEGCRKAEAVWLFHDPLERWDKWHARRFTGPNIRPVGLPFFAHGVPQMLKNVGALSMVADLAGRGEIDLARLHRLARNRRGFGEYQRFLLAKAQRKPGREAWVRRLLMLEPGQGVGVSDQSSGKNDDSASQTE